MSKQRLKIKIFFDSNAKPDKVSSAEIVVSKERYSRIKVSEILKHAVEKKEFIVFGDNNELLFVKFDNLFTIEVKECY